MIVQLQVEGSSEHTKTVKPVTLSRIEGKTAPDQISWMVRGGPADLGNFVHSSRTSPDETWSSHGF